MVVYSVVDTDAGGARLRHGHGGLAGGGHYPVNRDHLYDAGGGSRHQPYWESTRCETGCCRLPHKVEI